MIKNFLLLLFLGAAWGGAFSLIKYGLRTTGPITEMAARALIAFVTLFIVCLVLRKDIRPKPENWPGYFAFAILGLVQLWLADAYSLELITAGLGSVMVSVMPLATFVITALILRDEKVTLSKVGGLILGVAGLVLVIGIDNILAEGTVLKGVLLIMGGFVLFAVNGVFVPKMITEKDPIITMTNAMLIGAVILLALAFIVEKPLETSWDLYSILAELAFGIIATAGGYVVFYYLIENSGAFFASIAFYLLPVFGMLSGVIFLGDKTNASQIAGIGVVILGIYMINRVKAGEG